MGTEKCPFCGQEIEARATKCFFCGATLDVVSVGRRLEQLARLEHYSSGRRILRRLLLAAAGAGVLLALIYFYGIPGRRKPLSLGGSPESATVRLNAAVSFAGAGFVISNNDSFDWENVRLEVVPAEFEEPFYLVVAKIPAGKKYTAGVGEFRRNDGTRFDPFSTKSERFRIRCDTPEKRKGFYLAGLK